MLTEVAVNRKQSKIAKQFFAMVMTSYALIISFESTSILGKMNYVSLSVNQCALQDRINL